MQSAARFPSALYLSFKSKTSPKPPPQSKSHKLPLLNLLDTNEVFIDQLPG
jgi:hypothetical protein